MEVTGHGLWHHQLLPRFKQRKPGPQLSMGECQSHHKKTVWNGEYIEVWHLRKRQFATLGEQHIYVEEKTSQERSSDEEREPRGSPEPSWTRRFPWSSSWEPWAAV